MSPFAMRASCLLLLQVAATTAQSADHYVRAGATGTGSGLNWTDATTSLPPTLTRGDTYYVASGSYGPYVFDDALAGTAVIRVLKATPEAHGTSLGWDDSYGVGEALFQSSEPVWSFRYGYYEIDGVYGEGKSPRAYGFRLFSTASRSAGGDLLVYAGTISQLSVKHTEFDWDNGTVAGPNTAPSTCWASGLNPSDHVTIAYNYFHHTSGFVFYLGNYTGHPVQSDYLIEHNYFYMIGGGGGVNHHWELSWSTDGHEWDFRYNTIENVFGGVDGQTGWYMIGRARNHRIHGNLFFCSDASRCSVGGNGVIAAWSSDMYLNDGIYIYNNTFAGIAGGYGPQLNFFHPSGPDLNVVVKNNIYFNSDFKFTDVGTQSHEACGGGQACPGSNPQTGLNASWFRNASAGDFRLVMPTAPGDGSIGARYASDMNARVRGADGTWDRGAFEYSSGVKTLAAPRNLRLQ